jgi:hypothetical protein
VLETDKTVEIPVQREVVDGPGEGRGGDGRGGDGAVGE